MQRWSADLLQIFNLHIEIADEDPLHKSPQGLIVTNHVSWLDVFVLNAIIPMRFIAKSEVRAWPIIGWLCARAQTLFIERGNARSAARINVHMVDLLKKGECLAIFPEGTTTDGTQVAHFHAFLLQPAIDAGVPVHPIAIRYENASGEHCTIPAYINDISFGTSLWNILSAPELHVRLVAAPPLSPEITDRRDLTRMAHQHISTTLNVMHGSSAIRQAADLDVIEPPNKLHLQSF